VRFEEADHGIGAALFATVQLLQCRVRFANARCSPQVDAVASARTGARLAAGSDWAVSSANPLRAIHVAVHRSLREATGAEAEPFLPAQRLDLAEAAGAYTIGSAYVNHLDDVTGSIEAGKLADLVVLDRDPFTAPPGDIGGTSVIATYVQGEAVYRAPSLS